MQKKDTEQFKREVFDLVGNAYEVLGEYSGASSCVNIKHNVCGYEYMVIPFSFIRGNRCAKCYNISKLKTNNEFIEEVYELVGKECIFLEKYKGHDKKIKCKHNECGYEWKTKPNGFLSGRRCPQCAESKGEQIIRKYLENNNVRFLQEYEFDNLLSDKGNPLRFDFAIFNKKDNLISLIEYDGEFHFKDVYENGSFEVQQIHDKRKNQYCKDNDIPLLRIPYWEFDNIEEILDKCLTKYNLQQKVKVS